MISGSSSITTFGSRAAAGTAAAAVRSSVAHVSRVSARTCTLTSSTTVEARVSVAVLPLASAALIQYLFINLPNPCQKRGVDATWTRNEDRMMFLIGDLVDTTGRRRRTYGNIPPRTFARRTRWTREAKTLPVANSLREPTWIYPEIIHVGRHDDDDDLRERLSPTERHFGKPSGLAKPRRPTTFTHLF